MTTFEKVVNKIAEYVSCDVSEVKEDSTLASLQIDSLDMVEIVMSLEEMFDISIDATEEVNTVKELADLVDAKVSK